MASHLLFILCLEQCRYTMKKRNWVRNILGVSRFWFSSFLWPRQIIVRVWGVPVCSVSIWDWGPPILEHGPWVSCPQSTPSHSVSLCAVGQPADLCSPNISVINDWPSFWQLLGLKLNTFDKFYKDKNFAKGLFSQLKHFIPQLLSGAFQGSWGSHCCLDFKNEEEKCQTFWGHSFCHRKGKFLPWHWNTCTERRRTEGIAPFSPEAIV